MLPNFDRVDKFKRSGPPNHIQFSQRYGALFVAVENCLFTFQANNLFKLLTTTADKLGDIKTLVNKMIKVSKETN